MLDKYLDPFDNYIYISHLGEDGEFVVIPCYPESIKDTMNSTFEDTNALSRSAPVWSYAHSGPRSIDIQIVLHRDLFEQINLDVCNLKIKNLEDDLVETFIKKLQSIALPKYDASIKSVEPPMISCKFGNDVFIKGIVNGQVSVSYTAPILRNGKYANIAVGFTITEVDPYDAETVSQLGSFRGLTRAFKNKIYVGEE